MAFSRATYRCLYQKHILMQVQKEKKQEFHHAEAELPGVQ